jgi:hypothetical protein
MAGTRNEGLVYSHVLVSSTRCTLARVLLIMTSLGYVRCMYDVFKWFICFLARVLPIMTSLGYVNIGLDMMMDSMVH